MKPLSERDRNKELEIACADFSGRNVTLHTENLDLKRQIETQQKRIEEGWEREKELLDQIHIAQTSRGKSEMTEKIYFSKVNDPEKWVDAKSYWFPFAETLARKGHWRILKAYIWLRTLFGEKAK